MADISHMDAAAMDSIAGWLIDALRNSGNVPRLNAIAVEVEDFCRRFPVPGL